LTVERIARLLDAEAAVAGKRPARSISIDSRTLQPGALFVPLAGSRTDGHRFLAHALERGAAGLLVKRSLWRELSASVSAEARKAGAGVVLVGDTLEALQELARRHLEQHPKVFTVGITGSSGKTTTKEILASILEREAPTAASPGNLNSEIGLPLSCFEVTAEHRFVVFEMAINHPGEMDVLTRIASPELAVVTNIGTAHVGLLGSREAIAREKIRIARRFDGRQAAFLYEDDEFFELMAREVNGRVVSFGPRTTRGFEGSQDLGLDGTIVHWEGLQIRFPLFGFHNLLNALAALSVSAELGVGKSKIRDGLEAVQPLFGRSQILRGAVTVIQDSYNANPDSVGRLTEFLDALPWDGRKLMVLGSMKELGAEAEEAHRAIGRRISLARFDHLFLFGEEMRWAMEALREAASAGTAGRSAAAGPGAADDGGQTPFWTADFDELRRRLQATIRDGDLVVLKGSRSVELERLLSYLPVPAPPAGLSEGGGP